MLFRRIIVVVASITMSIGVVVFVLGRVVLGIAGSAEAVSAIVGEVTDLPEVRTELVDEIANQFASDPTISQYANDETVRAAVETVLSSSEFEEFSDEVSVAAYDVFFEGAPSAEIDVNALASIALDQLATATDSGELAKMAEEFGIQVDEGSIAAVTDEVVSAIEEGVLAEGIEPIVLERTESDVDLSGVVDSVRMWSNIGLALAVVSAGLMLVLSPAAFIRRLLPVGVALVLAGVVLFGISNMSGALPIDGVARPEMVRAIANSLVGRVSGPAYTMLIAGVAVSAISMSARFISRGR
ncbi:MAG: hypothetical protein ACO3HT_08445 [Ilumatobacteraceae bacterium]